MQDSLTPGLRERKRMQTRTRMEEAAVDIVLDDGLDALTIDAISERADVSPRTFFNYFDSKEDAILGLRTQPDAELLVADLLADIHPTSLVDGVLELLVRFGDGRGRTPRLRERRRRVVHRHPELLHRQFAFMGRMMTSLTQSVHTLLARLGEASGTADACTDAEAQIILMTCGAALRAAMTELACAGPEPATDIHTDDALRTVKDRATALVHDAAERLR